MGLFVAVERAENLQSNHKLGNGNPYFVFEYGKHDWKTNTKKGPDPEWLNEHHEFHTVRSNDELYVLHKDQNFGADGIVAAGIVDVKALPDVVHGWVTLFDDEEQICGAVLLTLSSKGSPSQIPNIVEIPSYINENIRTEMQKLKKSKNLKNYGAAAGAAIGAGLVGKKLYDSRVVQ